MAIPGPTGRQHWGARLSTPSANHRLVGPPTGSALRDGSFTLLCTVTGSSMFWDFGSLYQRRLRRHILRAVAAAVFLSMSLRRPRLRAAAQASRTSHGSDGWRSLVPRGDNTGGSAFDHPFRQPSPGGPADRFCTS